MSLVLNFALFLSLYAMIGFSIKYHQQIMGFALFNKDLDMIHPIPRFFYYAIFIIGFLMAFCGLILFFLLLVRGINIMFEYPNWFSYLKWHYLYAFVYLTFTFFRYKYSLSMVRAYNEGAFSVISDVFEEEDGYLYKSSETHKLLKEYYDNLKKNPSDKNIRSHYIGIIGEKHTINENKLYSSVQDLKKRQN